MASNTGRTLARWAAAALGVALSGAALAANWNLQPAATQIASDIHSLHEYVMVLVIVIFVGVFGAMFWSVYAHRKSKGHKAAQFHENTAVEIAWTVIPLLILVIIAWPVTRTVVAQKDTANADLTIKATGYQWKWGYDYLGGEGQGIAFVSTLATPR
ncbi:MAG: cytochrome c oxidase subunit II, partial [Betaproteobacteria bacterium]|nr:cytochrome c oxidase subunit II [Betaproteobacteria bacterium]